MAVDWNVDGMLMWREEAVKEQQACFKLLGTPMWREFEPSHYGHLKREIGYALFGVPEEEPSAKLNDGTGYTDKKLEHINRIVDIIINCTKSNIHPNNICVSFLFVFGKTKDTCKTVPVIRILHFDNDFKQNMNVFIDSCGRVYKNWKDYLDNNTIPECVPCYPRNGVYSAVNGAVEVEFGTSPAGRTGTKVLQGFDIAGKVLSVGAVGAYIAEMFVPVQFPVIAVSMVTGVYAAARFIQTQVDRNQHQQSIALDSDVSRNWRLGIEGGMISIVSGGTMAAAAQVAAPMPLVGQVAVKSVAVSSCVLNGLAVKNVLANIIVKALNEQDITALDVFQFTSALLFFTHTVISASQASSLINSMGMNSSGGSSFDLNDLMNRISEFVGPTKACNSVPLVIAGCLPTLLGIAEKKQLSLFSLCIVVGRKLIEVIKSLLKGLTSMCIYVKRVGELLEQVWESWNKEMDVIVDLICRASGVKHWSQLVIKGCRIIESGHIRAMANTLIAEKRSLVDCGNTAMPSHQRQADSSNSAFVGTDEGPNNLVDGEIQNYEFYYDEIAKIFATFVDRQMCKDPEDFCSYMRNVCKFVKYQFQKKKSHYEESWEMIKLFSPDVNVEDFKKKNGITGNPNNHFLQEVFNEFDSEVQEVFTLLRMFYEKENAGTSAQEEEDGQVCLDADGFRFYPFYSMSGLASNGLPSEQQYREIATKLTGRRADTDSISMSANGDTAVIQVNAEADVIMVRCWEEDGKVSGIAAILRTPSE